ncbi:helix-turn-helix domain-containing protein [Pacificibacter marinus]|uniref:helix-turn-helix domain-containing protein n=1 Tax=Pacificibacter marinus TaxID=658057 RepID=UPI001C066412|nr:helix-turn-helix domain-containing protein [Pacificibacter marinus]MBU2868690.1 helix-turn-helix domain-containing protein [Pacificibacter marinus]
MEYLLVVGSVQSLFTTVFLWTKRAKKLHDTILAVWMVFMAMPLIAAIAVQIWPSSHIPILSADLIYPLTYGPFLWLYVSSLTAVHEKIALRQILHFLPFVTISLFQLLSGWAPAPPNPDSVAFNTSIRVIGGVNCALLITYSIAVFRQLRDHDQKVLERFSNLQGYLTLAWIRWMSVGITSVFLLLFLAALLSQPSIMDLHLVSLIIAILMLSYFGLQQDQVSDTVETLDEPEQGTDATPAVTALTAEKPSYDRSGLSAELADVIQHRLDCYMQSERPYLNADLTITALAKRMAVPRHHLTEVINARHQKNFFNFVNEYRIQAVKQAMQDPARAKQTLLDMAYAAGFNSKSSFNTAFKQQTGMTPSQFRRQLE